MLKRKNDKRPKELSRSLSATFSFCYELFMYRRHLYFPLHELIFLVLCLVLHFFAAGLKFNNNNDNNNNSFVLHNYSVFDILINRFFMCKGEIRPIITQKFRF